MLPQPERGFLLVGVEVQLPGHHRVEVELAVLQLLPPPLVRVVQVHLDPASLLLSLDTFKSFRSDDVTKREVKGELTNR